MKIFTAIIMCVFSLAFVRALYGQEPLSLNSILREFQNLNLSLDDVMNAIERLRYFDWSVSIVNWYDIFEYVVKAFEYLFICIEVIADVVSALTDFLWQILSLVLRLFGIRRTAS